MLKGRSTSLLLLAAVLAAGAAWVANQWAVNRSLAPEQLRPDERAIVVANTDIPYGQKVEEQHVRVMKVSAAYAPDGVFANKEEVIGKVAQESVLRGDILRQSRFADHVEGSTLAALIGENKRAITVRVDDVIGVGGFLLPGNRVDVLATRKENKRFTTDTVLRDIRVLAVDQKATTDANDPVIVRAVTLEVEPRQAEIIVKSSNEGKIQLSLRNPNEEVVIAEEQPAPKKQVSRSYQPSMNVIRGTHVSTIRN